MSLRPEICGFDLAQMRSLFCSKNQKFIAAVQKEFDHQVARNPTGFDSVSQTAFHEALGRAIHQGVPFQELEAEKEPHVHLAVLLAQHQQHLLGTDANAWNWSGFSDFLDVNGSCRWFDYLLFGRPLFGKQIDAYGVYGYLSREEVHQLREWLQELHEEQDEPDEQDERWGGLSDEIKAQLNAISGNAERDQLLGDLCRWCDEIAAADKDLFIWWPRRCWSDRPRGNLP
jgi:hypothetical protein